MIRIGLSSCFFHADPQRAIFKGKTLLYLEQSISHWVMSAGAMAYLVPEPASGAPAQLEHYVADLDALVLQGGSDVAPQSYGETPLRPEWAGDGHRDRYEIALLRAFMAAGKPVLGVCRGLQLINVGLGGTLYQDIALQVPGARCHRDWEIYDQNFHSLSIEPGSGLSRLYPGSTVARVNSVHHQAIKELGQGLAIEARSTDDGIIEAVRYQGGSYVFAVQWHPEFHDPRAPGAFDDSRILGEFLQAAGKRKGK